MGEERASLDCVRAVVASSISLPGISRCCESRAAAGCGGGVARGARSPLSFRPESDCLELWQAVREREPLANAADPTDTHLLRLSDRT